MLLFTSSVLAQVAVIPNAPPYNFQVLPGSTRQINVNITSGTQNTINWSVLSTTGGASATFTDPTHTGVSALTGLATIQVNIGATAGTCSISGSIGTYAVSSSATVIVQAQSTDDNTKTANFLFNVCSPPTLTNGLLANGTNPIIVAPAYQQAFEDQSSTLQSWVQGCVDETVSWSIVSQPAGGNGTLSDTNNRDTVFTASVTGRYVIKATYVGANCFASGTVSNTAIVYVSPNSLPSYAATPNGTRPTECYPDPALTGGDYEVGSGWAYATPIAAPAWNTWPAGTIMRIHNTDTSGQNPTVYSNYMQVENSGTATQPMIVCGVADNYGNLPILDGTNATTQSTTSTALDGYGILFTWPGPAGGHYNYWQSGSAGPSYLTISGIHFRNATPSLNFVPPSGGSSPWVDGDGCIYLGSGSYIDIVGDELDTCTNGLATYANGNNAYATITQNVTVRGNHLTENGYSTEGGDHQIYNQSFYSLMEGNLLDHYLATAQGDAIKFRGIEGIIRYNYLGSDSTSSGPQRLIDEVEVQDASMYVTFEGYLSSAGDTNCDDSFWCIGDAAGPSVIAAYQESAQKDFIYGNAMTNAASQAEMQIHYAEDHSGGMGAKNGSLYFFNNTMDNAEEIFDTATGEGYDMYLQQRIFSQNNIFWNPNQIAFNRVESIILASTTVLGRTGSYNVSTPITGGSYSAGTSLGWSAGCDYACQWPLTNPMNPHLYNLTSANYLTTSTIPYTPETLVPVSGSAAIGAGTPLSGILSTMPVRWNFNQATNSLTPRVYPLTIGAEDQPGGAAGNPPASSPAATPTFSLAAGTYTSSQTVSISTTTPSATIYYTTNGSAPTTSSPVYSGPIAVASTETVEAIAVATGSSTSSVGSATYTITSAAATPTFSPAGGTYASAQKVSISTTTPSAKIYYTTDGSTPTTSSAMYSDPITVASTETIQAIAVTTGGSTSAVGSATYTITSAAATPTFSPAGGTYASAQKVSISTTTPSAKIYYTTDGSTPTTSSAMYSDPITVASTETIQTIAVATGSSTSAVGSATYTITSAAATPTFSPAGGTYSSSQTVSISTTTPSATVYYTTNGSAPTTSSAVYSGPITVASTETLQAIAVATGSSTSAVGSAAYTITSPAATPTFSPASGTYASSQTVSISTTTPSATVYYTTNGSAPTTSSAVYSGPITVASTETLQAIAVATGSSTSAVGSAAYTITSPAATPTFSPAGGTYSSSQTVSISTTTPSASIYYTTNGSTPTTSSPVYSSPVTVSASETVHAIAVATGSSASAVGSAAYTITLPAATPAFSPAGGTYASSQTVSISTTTPSATIYYTTNGSAPTTSSLVYSGPIAVASTETVEAIAVATGSSTSAVGSAAYTISSPAAMPTFSPAGGTYASSQAVSISTTTPSATVYYTTNGSTPTTSSPMYSGPVMISASETVHAIAVATGNSASAVGSAAYTITSPAATPTFSPAGGTYASSQTVSISTTTPSATIYYTTNGSAPTTSSSVYSGPIAVASTETVEAIAVTTGRSTSAVGSAAYTISSPTAAPTFSPAGGTYPSAQTVTISSSASSATIYYTTNGSTPTTSSPIYYRPITVAASETIKAIAVTVEGVTSGSRGRAVDVYSTSAVNSATYVVDVTRKSFTVAVSPASLTVTAGESGTATVLVAPQNGYASAVSLSCSGLPTGASCEFSPAPVTPSGAVASSMLTVTTSTAEATLLHNPGPSIPVSALAVVFCCFGWKRRRSLQMLLLAAVVVGLSVCTGCGVEVLPRPGVSTMVTILATDGNLQPSTSFSLTML
ncbi:MAG: chitobiase/beta-hexosaminidase C-terminal domain-containing protein [Acidobacteriaceae bacterium]